MAVTTFSRVKDALNTIFTDELLNTDTVQAIYPYRIYDLDTSPILILTTYDYNFRDDDGGDLVDIGVIAAVKFSGQSEAQTAEQVLDDIEQVIIDLFNSFDGKHRVYDQVWGAVDFVPARSRPASPFGPGTRYMEKILRIHAYGP